MREIRFRFWSGQKMFYTFNEVIDCLKQQLAFNDNIIGAMQCDHVGEYGGAFMQYIGLKDKNNKEIYEGDIIKTINGNWGVIVYKNHCFEVTVSSDQSSFYTVEWMCQSEVIGNIYENPELL